MFVDDVPLGCKSEFSFHVHGSSRLFPPPPSGPALQLPLIQSASMRGSCSDKNKDVNL